MTTTTYKNIDNIENCKKQIIEICLEMGRIKYFGTSFGDEGQLVTIPSFKREELVDFCIRKMEEQVHKLLIEMTLPDPPKPSIPASSQINIVSPPTEEEYTVHTPDGEPVRVIPIKPVELPPDFFKNTPKPPAKPKMLGSQPEEGRGSWPSFAAWAAGKEIEIDKLTKECQEDLFVYFTNALAHSDYESISDIPLPNTQQVLLKYK